MPNYSVSLEWPCEGCSRCGILRLHPAEGAGLGDPFVWSAYVVREGDVAHVKGVDRDIPDASAFRALVRALAEAGMPRRKYERVGTDRVRKVEKTARG